MVKNTMMLKILCMMFQDNQSEINRMFKITQKDLDSLLEIQMLLKCISQKK